MTNRCPGCRSLRNDFHMSFAIIFKCPTSTNASDLTRTELQELLYSSSQCQIYYFIRQSAKAYALLKLKVTPFGVCDLWSFIWASGSQRNSASELLYGSLLHSRGTCMIDKVLWSVVYLNRLTSGHAGPHYTFCHLNLLLVSDCSSALTYFFKSAFCVWKKDTNYGEVNENRKYQT